MFFAKLVGLEFLLLLAAGLTVLNGIRGSVLAAAILSAMAWLLQPENFFFWESVILTGWAAAAGVSLGLAKKSEHNSFATGFAGGITFLALLGAMVPMLIALVLWILVVGTGLIPMLQKKQVLWGIAPLAWRVVTASGWFVLGNLLI